MVQRFCPSPDDMLGMRGYDDGDYVDYDDYAALEQLYNQAISDVVNKHSRVVELEQRCEELEASQQTICSGVEGGIYKVHSDKVYSTMKREIDKLEAENAELRKRVSLLDNLYLVYKRGDDAILRQTYEELIKMKYDITQT